VHYCLKSVTPQSCLDHQNSISDYLDTLGFGDSYKTEVLGCDASAAVDACHTVTLDGIAEGETNYERMGVYTHVHDTDGVYRDAKNEYYLFKHTIKHTSHNNGVRWLVGKDYHTDGAVLLTETDVIKGAKDWFSYKFEHGKGDAEQWHPVQVAAECGATPVTCAHVLFEEQDCVNPGGSADIHKIKAAVVDFTGEDAMQVYLNAHGLATTAVTVKPSILVSCEPVIHLIMPDDSSLHPKTPATCHYKDGSIVIDHKPAGFTDNYHCKYHFDQLSKQYKCMCKLASEPWSAQHESFAP